MDLITCKQAKELGKTRYFTGKFCPNGHIAERYVSGRGCVECTMLKKKEYEAKHKHTAKFKAKQAVRSKRWNEDHKEDANLNHYKWVKRNPHMPVAAQARYRANKRQQTPAWASHEKINDIYSDCRELTEALGMKFHVDHIVPLQGKYVSGLHWEENLQILGAVVNQSKGNKLISYEREI